MEAVQESQTKRRSFISRLRSTKSEKVTKADATSEAPTETEPVVESDETRHPSPSTGAQPHPATVTREGVPIISAAAGTDHSFKPSDVRQNRKFTKKGVKVEKKSIRLAKAPAARDSAFSGPPRYDWIDIETAAAIKVQSIYRRNKVMDDMAAQGLETTAMRNRRRRRRARSSKSKSTNEDAPGCFQFCGIGLLFGDATEQDEKERRAFEKAQYEEKKRLQFEKEAALRTYRPRAKASTHLEESIEIIE